MSLYRNEVLCNMAREHCQLWYSSRIKLVSMAIKAFGMAVCISKKGEIGFESITLILLLQYTAEMGWIWSFF